MSTNGINIRLESEAMEQLLIQMPEAFARSVLRSAGRKALKPIAQEAKMRAPRDEGFLEDSIKVKSLRNSGTVLVGVDIKAAGSKKLTAAGKAAIVEGGTGERTFKRPHTFTTAAGVTVRAEGSGSMPAIPFMMPAIEAGASSSLKSYNEHLAKSLIQKMDRTIKKYGK